MSIIRFPPYVDLRKPARMASHAAMFPVRKRANYVRQFFNRIRKQARGLL